MTKSQTKIQNLTLKIQKLARLLNKFSVDDIQQLIPENEKVIRKVINKLIAKKVIKPLSESEYLYSKVKESIVNENIKLEIAKANPSIGQRFNDNEWLTMDEVIAITEEKRETIRRKCKNGIYKSIFKRRGKIKEYLINKVSLLKSIKPRHTYHQIKFTYKEFPKILHDDFKFDDVEEQKIYDNAYDFQKKRVKKFITLFRLAGKLAGKELQEYLESIAKENPNLKTSYSTYVKTKWRYKKEGIKALIPQYGQGHKGKSIVSQDMYEDFKKIYLSSTKYSIQTAVEELPKLGYPEDILPSYRTFERLIKKEYSAEYIKAQREAPCVVANIEFDSDKKTIPKAEKPLYEKYINAARAYLKKYEKDKSNTHICRRGYIKNHLTPFFKKYYFSDITNETIREYVQYKLSQGYAMASIKRFLSTFAAILVEYNILNNLTLSDSNLPIMDEQCKTLNDYEIKQIIKNQDEKLWILCLGINPAELEALEYSDIDFKNQTIKIDKCIFNNKVEKYRKLYKIRNLRLPKILFKTILKNKKGRIFKNVQIENYDILLNSHVKLLLDKNIQINIISKNLGFQKLTDFEKRFQNLLPQKLDDDFEIF